MSADARSGTSNLLNLHRIRVEIVTVLELMRTEVRTGMAKDPVCGMMVDEKAAKWKTTYAGRNYYFCAEACKRTFEKDPRKYVK
jgi:Cu+-exporting ATPase